MRIEIDLPDWADERNIHIFAGIEEVARKHKDAPWEIKISRCSMCGQCCKQLPKSHPFRSPDGECYYLEKEPGNNELYRCGLGVQRPHGCAISVPSNILECTVRYEEVK